MKPTLSPGPVLDAACAAVEERLPWLVNDTLAAGERRDVETHLAVCERCRASLAAERDFARLVATPRDNVDVAPHAAWRALEARLDATAANPPAQTGAAVPAHDDSRAASAGDSPAPARPRARRNRSALVWIVAAQAAAIAGLTLVLWRVAAPPGDATFRTLSSPEAVPAPAGIAIRLAVERTATAADVQRLADGIAARVVAGPDARGIATLALPGSESRKAASAVEWLRAQPVVLLAERIDGGATEPGSTR